MLGYEERLRKHNNIPIGGNVPTRIYVIINQQTGEKRLVEASTGAQAIRHCVSQVYTAKVAGTKDVAGFMREGMQVETAGETEKETNAEQPA